jgi:hypothetical protein
MKIGLVVLTVATLVTTGCAGFQSGSTGLTPSTVNLNHIHGNAHGGQNPISTGAVQVYQAGTTGYGTGATALIPGGSYYAGGATGCVTSPLQVCYSNVVTDTNGNFDITGLYSCASGSQVYLTVTGGNTGNGVNNASLIMAGLGLCDNVPSIPFIEVNEVTAVGTVWALSPFMSDVGGVIGVGAPSTNQAGLVEAFADINTLVSYAAGSSPGTAVPVGATVPSQEIFAIANSLAACINSSGVGGVCGTLFGYTTVNGTTPTDVIGAAIDMARYPAQNASNILMLASAEAPFASTFNASTVNDLTLAVSYTGGGLNSPSALAIDGSGNVWVANSGNSSVSEFGNKGTALSGTNGYTAGSISSPSAITIDTAGHVWVANAGNATLTELSSTGTNVGSSPFSGGGLSGLASISIDMLGDVWVANYSNSSVSEFSPTGTAMSGTSGFTATGLSSPFGVAINPK